MKPNQILLFLLTFILIACGQPGPLYMPAKPAPVPVKPEPVVTPEPAKNNK